MKDTALKTLLDSSRSVAVVGLSTDPEKPSSKVAEILMDAGYEIIPIHPTASAILGRKAFPSLAEVPIPIDIVDVFRPAGEAPEVARQAASVGATSLWLQLGIVSDEARSIADAAGMNYVEDTCIGATTERLGSRAAAAAD